MIEVTSDQNTGNNVLSSYLTSYAIRPTPPVPHINTMSFKQSFRTAFPGSPPGEPITIIIGEPDMYIYKGSTINLTCVVKHSPEPPPAIYWTHNSELKRNGQATKCPECSKKCDSFPHHFSPSVCGQPSTHTFPCFSDQDGGQAFQIKRGATKQSDPSANPLYASHAACHRAIGFVKYQLGLVLEPREPGSMPVQGPPRSKAQSTYLCVYPQARATLTGRPVDLIKLIFPNVRLLRKTCPVASAIYGFRDTSVLVNAEGYFVRLGSHATPFTLPSTIPQNRFFTSSYHPKRVHVPLGGSRAIDLPSLTYTDITIHELSQVNSLAQQSLTHLEPKERDSRVKRGLAGLYKEASESRDLGADGVECKG
uniref:Ig-like domain-containing protein n=1 Tax=Timema cristinae TaxID=61476 RepID=A0A7R9CL33_TIMCR|nr:unnamed protein product [Timema cristinae]